MERHELEPGVFLTLSRAFVSEPEASAIHERLIDEVAWEQGRVRFFGKLVAEPRLSAWFGERDYTYSGRTVKRAPFPPTIASLLRRVEAATNATFNAVLVNRYRDGRDGMGFHSDDEPELGPRPLIASLSFGVARRFVLEKKRAGARERAASRFEVELGHGDLLVMGGACQTLYRHAVPKQPRVQGERINLTFRRIVREGALEP
jgi:alkylated DNA repair dioxygenase AlkB